MSKGAQKVTNPGCLGQMAQKYCKYCSDKCPITSSCVRRLMSEYLRNDHKPSQGSTDVRFLTLPPLIVPPDQP